MLDIIQSIIPLFLIMAIGAAISPFIDKDKWIEVLNKYGLYIGFPAIIISGLTSAKDYSNLDFSIVGANFSILIISIVLIFLFTSVFKLKKEIRNTYLICSFWGNVAYLGFPLVSGLFPGSDSLISIIIAVYLLIVFTIGILILEISKENKSPGILNLLKNLFKNPLLLAVLFGIALVILDVTFPPVIQKPIEMFAASASPVVLLSLGIFIFRKINFNKKVYHAAVISFYKLIALPLIFIFLLQFFEVSKSAASVSIIEAAMPLAITPFALAEIYPLDKEIVAMGVIISTLMSLFTITAITFLVR